MRKARIAFPHLPRQGRRLILRRNAATNAATVDASVSAEPDIPKCSVTLPTQLVAKNLLRAASDLAQRSIVKPDVWVTSAENAVNDLQVPRKPVIACELPPAAWDLPRCSPRRLTVYGDIHSGARHVVTALLEDPLSDDQDRRNALTGRHDKHGPRAPPLRIR